MSDGRHLGKIEKSLYLGNGLTVSTKFGTATHFGPLERSDR